MTSAERSSWYIPAKPTSYSIAGFLVALIGGALLATGLDLFGQILLAVVNGGTADAVVDTLAGRFADLAGVAGTDQVRLVGLAVHFAAMLIPTLIYLIAASRIALINSTPEISVMWFGLLTTLLMLWVVAPLRWPDQALVADPGVILWQILRYTLLVALPIATLAKATARSR